MIMFRKTTLKNGLRIITAPISNSKTSKPFKQRAFSEAPQVIDILCNFKPGFNWPF